MPERGSALRAALRAARPVLVDVLGVENAAPADSGEVGVSIAHARSVSTGELLEVEVPSPGACLGPTPPASGGRYVLLLDPNAPGDVARHRLLGTGLSVLAVALDGTVAADSLTFEAAMLDEAEEGGGCTVRRWSISVAALATALALVPMDAEAYCRASPAIWSDTFPVRVVIHPDLQNYLRHPYVGPGLVPDDAHSCSSNADCGTDGLCVMGYSTAPINRCRGRRWTRGELVRSVQWAVSRINQDSGADVPLVFVDTTDTSACPVEDNCSDADRPWMSCFESDTVVLIPGECAPAAGAGMDALSGSWTGSQWADWPGIYTRNELIRIKSSNDWGGDPRLGQIWSHYSGLGLAANFDLSILHELGYALGLGHVVNTGGSLYASCIPNVSAYPNSVCPIGQTLACSVMGSFTGSGERRGLNLHSFGYDDMQGLMTLYGRESLPGTGLYEDWDLSAASFSRLTTTNLPLITNLSAAGIPSTSASAVIVGGREYDWSLFTRFLIYEWNWWDYSTTLRTTISLPAYASTGPIGVSVSSSHRVLSSHAMRLTADGRRYYRRIHDVRDPVAGGGWVAAISDPAPADLDDTAVAGVSAAYHSATGATLHVIRDNDGQILIRAFRVSAPSPGTPQWSNVIATGAYSFAQPSIACSPNRCFIAFTELPFPASTSTETRLSWIEGTFSWGGSPTSASFNNLSGVTTTWNNITSDPVASVVYNPAGGWYFYVAVTLPALISGTWGSRGFVYRKSEGATGSGALQLMLPQVADFPYVFVQPTAAGTGGYAEIFTSSSF